MKLLVTGGAGFIGSCFVRLLIRENPEFEITTLDALTYAGSKGALAEVESSRKHRFVQGDITNRKLVTELFGKEKFHAVINFAAESHVDRSIVSPDQFIKTNVMGTQVLLDCARKAGVERFVQISTDEVYGSLGDQGCFRHDTPLDPSSPYSASKAAADLLCLAFHRTYNFPVLITRSVNNYGPFQFPEKLIPVLIAKARADEKLPVYGNGMNVRSWIHVEDNCRAIRLALLKGKSGAVYLIGGETEMHNLDVAKLVLRVMGKPESLIQFVTDRPGHDWRYCLDGSQFAGEFSFKHTVTFSEGLRSTIEWYEKNQPWTQGVLAKSG